MKLIRLVGIMLLLYVKQEHAEYISEMEAETVGTGIMGRMVCFPAGTCGMWRALVPKVFFFFLFTAIPAAHGSSQARGGQIGVAAVAYITITATLDLNCLCDSLDP